MFFNLFAIKKPTVIYSRFFCGGNATIIEPKRTVYQRLKLFEYSKNGHKSNLNKCQNIHQRYFPFIKLNNTVRKNI